MALADDIRQRLQSLKAQAPQQSQAKAIQQQLAAKTGKAGGAGPAPRASRVGEQVAAGQAATAGRQLTQQQVLQGEQLGTAAAQQQQQTDLAREGMAAQGRMTQQRMGAAITGAAAERAGAGREFGARLDAQDQAAIQNALFKTKEAKQAMLSERGITEDQLFEEFRQGREELAMRKDASKLNQAMFLEALSNEKYVTELQRTGKLSRLEDEAQWKEDTWRLVMGRELAQYMDELGWKDKYNDKERSFEEHMAQLDVEHAEEIAKKIMNSENKKSMVEGGQKVGFVAGTIVGGIVGTSVGGPGGGMVGATAGGAGGTLLGGMIGGGMADQGVGQS